MLNFSDNIFSAKFNHLGSVEFDINLGTAVLTAAAKVQFSAGSIHCAVLLEISDW